MFKPRFIFRFLFAFVLRFKTLLILGLCLGFFLSLIFLLRSSSFIKGTTQVIGVTGRFSVDSLPLEILSLSGRGLTKINAEGLVEPDLAESWESIDSGKTWQFTLKDDIFWQDGEVITADSLNYGFLNVPSETPDAKTIIFKLENPFAPFPWIVSRPTFKSGLLGAGEWEVTDISLGGNFVQKLILANKNKDKKIFKFYPLEERSKLAYKLGEVDILTDLFDPKPFDSWETAEITTEVNFNRYVAIFLNTEEKKLSQKSLRQALAYGLDKGKIGEQRTISTISPTSWAYNPQVKSYELDIQRAKDLISELPEEIKNDLSVNLVTTPTLLSDAEKIVKEWENIGVKTVLQVSSSTPSEFQAFLVALDIPTDPDQYTLWHSTQVATNLSKYKNPRIDKLLEDGRVTLDLEERRKIYLDFQRFLVEDSPAIFLYHPISYTVKRK